MFINKNNNILINRLKKIINNNYFKMLENTEKVSLLKECFKNQILVRKNQIF